MSRGPPVSTRTATLFPSSTLFRSFVLPRRVPPGHDHVDPQQVAGLHEHRSSPAAPAHHVDAGSVARRGIGDGVGLRAAEHERGPGHVTGPDRALGRLLDPAGVEGGGVLLVLLQPPGHADSVAGRRYGPHCWGTEPRATTTQLSSVGAAGRHRRTIVVSTRSRSRLRTLQARHAATTFSHSCCPPRLRGTTWSMISAAAPQYWIIWS